MSVIAGLVLMQAAAVAAPPSAEAVELGVRLARNGVFSVIAPEMAKADSESLVAAHPELTPADRERLRATSAVVAREGIARADAAFGRAYAERLTLDELRALVAQAESPAQRRFRTVLPQAMAAAMPALGAIDLKKETAARFCRETGKLCEAKRK